MSLTSSQFTFDSATGEFTLKASARLTSSGGSTVTYDATENIAGILINDASTGVIAGGLDLPIPNSKSLAILRALLDSGNGPATLAYESCATAASGQVQLTNNLDSTSIADGTRFASIGPSEVNPSRVNVSFFQKASLGNVHTAISVISSGNLYRQDLTSAQYTLLANNNLADNTTNPVIVNVLLDEGASSTGKYSSMDIFFANVATNLGSQTFEVCPPAPQNLVAASATPDELTLTFTAPTLNSPSSGNGSTISSKVRVTNLTTLVTEEQAINQADTLSGTKTFNSTNGNQFTNLAEGQDISIALNFINTSCTGDASTITSPVTDSLTGLSWGAVSVTQDQQGNYNNVSCQPTIPNTERSLSPSLQTILKRRNADGTTTNIDSNTQMGQVDPANGNITFNPVVFLGLAAATYFYTGIPYDGALAGISADSDDFVINNALPSTTATLGRRGTAYNQIDLTIAPLDSLKYGVRYQVTTDGTDPSATTGTKVTFPSDGSSRVIQLADLSASGVSRVAIQPYLLSDDTRVGVDSISNSSYVYILQQIGSVANADVDEYNVTPDGTQSLTASWDAPTTNVPAGGITLFYKIYDYTGLQVSQSDSLEIRNLPPIPVTGAKYFVRTDGKFTNPDESVSVNEDPSRLGAGSPTTSGTNFSGEWTPTTPSDSYLVNFLQYSYTSDATISNFYEFVIPESGSLYNVAASGHIREWIGSNGSVVADTPTTFSANPGAKVTGQNLVASFVDGVAYKLKVSVKLTLKTDATKIVFAESETAFGPTKSSAPSFAGTAIVINAQKNGGYVDVQSLGGLSGNLAIYAILENGSCQEIQMNPVVGKNFFNVATTLLGAVASLSTANGGVSAYESA